MFIPLTALPNVEGVEICIIGAGAAGITIARKLGAQGRKVVLCEGGTLEYTDESQNLYAGTVEGDDYFPLDATRLRYFGGSTNHWGGMCRPLDAADFRPKSASPNTGWPITKSNIDPFLKEAFEILETQSFADDRMIPGSGLRQIDFSTTDQPVRFAEKYMLELERSQNIFVCLNANLISFQADDDRILTATFSTVNGTQQHALKATYYVLATGGIENSRLLLWANELNNGKIVKHADTLGRYWCEHPHITVAEAVVSSEANFVLDREGRVHFAPTEQTMQEKDILNCRLSLGMMQLSRTRKLINDLACVAPALGKWAFDVMERQLFCGMRIRAAWEQEPIPENRITLSTDRDPLQIPRPILHWRKTALDFKTCRETMMMLAYYFVYNNKGRVRIADWLLNNGPWPHDELALHHHIGGTRMASDPKRGVVDSNQQVFGMPNLFVAGSSVFPNGGYANPTLTIVQLSVRLAEYLDRRLRRMKHLL